MLLSQVYGFKSIESVAKILHVLRNSTHNGFPVFVKVSGRVPVSWTVASQILQTRWPDVSVAYNAVK